jgi:hypothetical protein
MDYFFFVGHTDYWLTLAAAAFSFAVSISRAPVVHLEAHHTDHGECDGARQGG